MRHSKHYAKPREYKVNNKRPQYREVSAKELPEAIRHDLSVLCFNERNFTVHQRVDDPKSFIIRLNVVHDNEKCIAKIRVYNNSFKSVIVKFKKYNLRDLLEMYFEYIVQYEM